MALYANRLPPPSEALAARQLAATADRRFHPPAASRPLDSSATSSVVSYWLRGSAITSSSVSQRIGWPKIVTATSWLGPSTVQL